MKKLLVSLSFLVACVAPRDLPVGDAGVDAQLVDAHLDAARPQNYGCAMGNLPTSRTITLNPSDPVPSALLNEIQDQFVGRKTTQYSARFFPSTWMTGGGAFTATCVTNPATPSPAVAPVWKLPTGVLHMAQVPFVPGETSKGVSFEAFGDGVIDFDAELIYYPGLGSGIGSGVNVASASFANAPSSWQPYTLALNVSQILAATGILMIQLSPSTGTFLHVGPVSPAFAKP